MPRNHACGRIYFCHLSKVVSLSVMIDVQRLYILFATLVNFFSRSKKAFGFFAKNSIRSLGTLLSDVMSWHLLQIQINVPDGEWKRDLTSIPPSLDCFISVCVQSIFNLSPRCSDRNLSQAFISKVTPIFTTTPAITRKTINRTASSNVRFSILFLLSLGCRQPTIQRRDRYSQIFCHLSCCCAVLQ